MGSLAIVREGEQKKISLGGDILRAEELRSHGKINKADDIALDVISASTSYNLPLGALATLSPRSLERAIPPEFRPAASRGLALIAGSTKYQRHHRPAVELLYRAIALNPGNKSAFYQLHAICSFALNRDLTREVPDVQLRRQEMTRELGFIFEAGKAIINRISPNLLGESQEGLVPVSQRNSEDVGNLLWIVARVGLRRGRGMMSDNWGSKEARDTLDTASLAATRILNLNGVTAEKDPAYVLDSIKFRNLVGVVESGHPQCLDAIRVIAASNQLLGTRNDQAMYGFSLLALCAPWEPGFGQVGRGKLDELKRDFKGEPSKRVLWDEFQDSLTQPLSNGTMIALPSGFFRQFDEATRHLSSQIPSALMSEMEVCSFTWKHLIHATKVGFGEQAGQEFFRDQLAIVDQIDTRIDSSGTTINDLATLIAAVHVPRFRAQNNQEESHNRSARSLAERAQISIARLQQRRGSINDGLLAEALDNVEDLYAAFSTFTGTIMNQCQGVTAKKGEIALIMPGYEPLVINGGTNDRLESRWLAGIR